MPVSTPRRGRLFVIAAPSGAGKTSLVRALMERVPSLAFSVSFTTRPRRANEQNGRDYHFIDEGRFQEMVREGVLLEHAEVFGNHYGTGREQVEQAPRTNGRKNSAAMMSRAMRGEILNCITCCLPNRIAVETCFPTSMHVPGEHP